MGARKKATKTARRKKLDIQLSMPQTDLLRRIAPNTHFQSVGDHHRTQQALIDRGLARTDATGKKIKPTAKGKKVAKTFT